MSQEIFFTSDHHFGHRAILTYAKRPWDTVEEMDEALIKAWNDVVGPNDYVYHLGDFSFHKKDRTLSILCRLNGIKCLVQGNHDEKRVKGELRDLWHWVKPYYELKVDSRKIVLCHYPFDTWNKAHYGSWHLHGHCHNTLRTYRGHRLDVGVDNPNSEYAPWSYDKVAEYMKNMKYEPVDHHDSNRKKR